MASEDKKLVKKKWYKLVAPKLMNNQVLGEIIGKESESLINSTVKFDLMTLTNDPKRQGIYAKMKVTSVQGDNAILTTIGYSMIPATVRRKMKKGVGKVEDSFVVETGDKQKVVVKVFILTRAKVSKSILRKIRKQTREFIAEYVKKNKYENIIYDLLDSKLQRTIKDMLTKVYPIRVCEIRDFELKDKNALPIVSAEPVEEEKAEEVQAEKIEEVKEPQENISE